MKEKEVIMSLYQNVDMGVIGIESIESKIESPGLAKLILAQKEDYQKLKQELLKFCQDYNVQDKELGAMAKISSDMMSKMKLMMDNSDSHIAKMMMEGTNKGLISLEKLANDYQGSDKDLRQKIQEIIQIEQQNNEDLKIYL